MVVRNLPCWTGRLHHEAGGHFDPDQIPRLFPFPHAFLHNGRPAFQHVRLAPLGPSARTIIELNIKHYRDLLKLETNPARRQTIGKLLAEEEAKLAALQSQDSKEN
jgi:hypothetical protein